MLELEKRNVTTAEVSKVSLAHKRKWTVSNDRTTAADTVTLPRQTQCFQPHSPEKKEKRHTRAHMVTREKEDSRLKLDTQLVTKFKIN